LSPQAKRICPSVSDSVLDDLTFSASSEEGYDATAANRALDVLANVRKLCPEVLNETVRELLLLQAKNDYAKLEDELFVEKVARVLDGKKPSLHNEL